MEEEKVIFVNDIKKVEEISNLDMSSLFILSKLHISPPLDSKFIYDLQKKISKKKYINLSLNPTIKIWKYKFWTKDIIKSRKNKDIKLLNYNIKKDYYSLDIRNIDNYKRISWPYSDIHKPHLPLHSMAYVSLRSKIKAYIKKILKSRRFLFTNIIFILLIVISIFWYKQIIQYNLNSISNNIKTLSKTNNILEIENDLYKLKRDIVFTNILLQPIYFLNIFIWIDSVWDLKNILSWWKDIVSWSLDLVIIYNKTKNLIDEKWVWDVMYTQLLKSMKTPLILSYNKFHNWLEKLSKVNDLWSKELNEAFKSNYDKLKTYLWYIEDFTFNIDNLLEILWDDKRKTYMIIMQNRDEIRPTWWFMWSVAFISFFKWKVVDFETRDIYDIEWSLKEHTYSQWVAFNTPAPEWINKLTPTFWLRDSNYFFDIQKSSEKIKEFIDKTHYQIDWIIYINQWVIIDLLDKFTPVYYSEIDEYIDGSNFSYIISSLVESKVSHKDTLSSPKDILFDFIDDFIKEYTKNPDYLGFINQFFNSIDKRDIIIYFFDDKLNNFVKEVWFINNYDLQNYLDFTLPIFTSISWNKSDRYINFNFDKYINIKSDCSIESSFNISLRHSFNLNDEIKIKTFLQKINLDLDYLEYILDIQWRWDNKQFVRLYLPKDVIINNSNLYSINKTSNYTEISFYLDTKRLTSSSFKIDYTINNPECRDYVYKHFKQPWIKNYNLNIYKDWNLIDNIYTDRDFIYIPNL